MYKCVSINCGSLDVWTVQTEVETLLAQQFKSFKRDGGGMVIGSNVRDIFFNINKKESEQVVPFLMDEGFRVVNFD